MAQIVNTFVVYVFYCNVYKNNCCGMGNLLVKVFSPINFSEKLKHDQ